MHEINEHPTTDFEAAIKAGIVQATLAYGEDTPFAVVPEGYRLHNLEEFHDFPRRIRQTASFLTVGDLVRYIRFFFPKENPAPAADLAIFVTETGFVDGVLDYHSAAAADWCRHRARFTPQETPEWTAWTSMASRFMSQVEFAAFIEEHAEDVVVPSGADMLELARNLSAKRNVEFQSKVELSSGDVQFQYSRETKTGTDKGTISVPEIFEIAVRPYRGFDGYRVSCRLLYRISDEGQLTFAFKILKLEDVRERAAKEIYDLLQEEFADERLFWGSI